MDDLRFYVRFKSTCISIIARRSKGDNEWLCAMEPRLRLKDFRLPDSISRPLDQQARA